MTESEPPMARSEGDPLQLGDLREELDRFRQDLIADLRESFGVPFTAPARVRAQPWWDSERCDDRDSWNSPTTSKPPRNAWHHPEKEAHSPHKEVHFSPPETSSKPLKRPAQEPAHLPGMVGSTEDDDDDDDDKAVHTPTAVSHAPTTKSHQRIGAFGAIGQHAHKEVDFEEEMYDVANFYHTTGFAQALARSENFINFTLCIISANAVFMGLDAEFNSADTLLDADWSFQVCENLFCAFFTFEWATRFSAFASKWDCLKDGWFKFDGALVLMMIIETWCIPLLFLVFGFRSDGFATAPLRLLRLARLSRLARILRSLPELITMIRGMVVASRAVASSLLMVALLVYVFAIVMHTFLKDATDVGKYYGSIPNCMWTLLLDGTLLDNTGEVLDDMLSLESPAAFFCVFAFMVFILLSSMTVLNMLIGVLCEVVSTVAAEERDKAAVVLLKDTILTELRRFDEDGNDLISQLELRNLMKDWKAFGVPTALAIDENFLLEAQNLLFPSFDSEVRMHKVMEQMLICRGDSVVTVKHMAFFMDLFDARLRAALSEAARTRLPNRKTPLDSCMSMPHY